MGGGQHRSGCAAQAWAARSDARPAPEVEPAVLCTSLRCAALHCTVLYCLQVEAYLAEQDVGGEGAHEEEEEVVEPA